MWALQRLHRPCTQAAPCINPAIFYITYKHSLQQQAVRTMALYLLLPLEIIAGGWGGVIKGRQPRKVKKQLCLRSGLYLFCHHACCMPQAAFIVKHPGSGICRGLTNSVEVLMYTHRHTTEQVKNCASTAYEYLCYIILYYTVKLVKIFPQQCLQAPVPLLVSSIQFVQ